jgi:hypothetical protein
MKYFTRLYSYSARHSDLREFESIVWVCVLAFAITVQVGNHIYYITVIKMISNYLKCAWQTYFVLHLCETNRALVVTPKMMIFCMLKHLFHQSLCWHLCNKSCGFAGYECIQSMGDFFLWSSKIRDTNDSSILFFVYSEFVALQDIWNPEVSVSSLKVT